MTQLAPKPQVPVLAAKLPLTNSDDGYLSNDALSLPSDGSGPTSVAESTSPASSVGSDLPDDTDEGKLCEVQLPKPFYPPSMAQASQKVGAKPRELPANLGLPVVPREKATSAIDPQDKWVILVGYLLEMS